MKTKIKNFFNSRWTIFLLAFFIGGFTHFAVTNNSMAEVLKVDKKTTEKKDTDVKMFSDNYMNDFEIKMEEHFKRIREEQEKLFSDFNFSQKDPLSLKESIEIKTREDDKYKYVEIDSHDNNKDYLKVDIDNGLIRIYGEIKDEKKEDNDNHKMYYSFASSVSRTLSIPPGVNEKKAEILKEQNKIIVKFPKIEATT